MREPYRGGTGPPHGKMMEMGLTLLRRMDISLIICTVRKTRQDMPAAPVRKILALHEKEKECLYNILIMEEMQSIAALGAGASTKCYDRQRHIVSRWKT